MSQIVGNAVSAVLEYQHWRNSKYSESTFYNAMEGELQAATPNTPLLPPLCTHLPLSFSDTSSLYRHPTLSPLYAFLFLSSSPSFLLLLSILINMLSCGCQVRKAGRLCVFTSCSVKMLCQAGMGPISWGELDLVRLFTGYLSALKLLKNVDKAKAGSQLYEPTS